MYELIRLSEHDYYIDCPAKIGIIKLNETDVCLIDSGSDKSTAKKIYKILNEQGWVLKTIYNTHSHADHCGGNRWLQEKCGCEIYAKGRECLYSKYPELEPSGLYGGLPFKDIENKFLKAEGSVVNYLSPELLPEGMELLELPGHSFEMVGFLTRDGNAFIADSVISENTIKKYGIGYLWNPVDSLKTLEYLKTVKAKKYVPAHAEVSESIDELIKINIDAINETKNRILKICEKELSFEEILRQIFYDYNMTMNPQQYMLIGSTVRSYLSSMYTCGLLSFTFEDNRMKWKSNDKESC